MNQLVFMQTQLKFSLIFSKPPNKITTSGFSNTCIRLFHSCRNIKHLKKSSIINIINNYCFFKKLKQNTVLSLGENI